jgi:hypothetical protein
MIQVFDICSGEPLESRFGDLSLMSQVSDARPALRPEIGRDMALRLEPYQTAGQTPPADFEAVIREQLLGMADSGLF